MKKRFILLALLLTAVGAFAQAPDWQWAAQAGGSSNNDYGRSITIDDAGNSYVTGKFGSTATFGAFTLTTSGNSDIFVAKMDADGNWLWANQSGGTGYGNDGLGIAVDNFGNCFVTGYFQYTATFGASSLSSEGAIDIFVAKLDADGNWLWAIQSSGISYGNKGRGITIDGIGNIYVTGYFQETATFGAYSLTSYGETDILVAKIDSNGYWLWASQAGSTSGEYSCGITIGSAGSSYVTGFFNGTATFGAYSLTTSGNTDIFVAKIDSNGDWQWAVQAGGYWGDISRAISTDAAGNSYLTGSFNTSATFGSFSLTSFGGTDIFVAKIDANGDWQWVAQAGNYNYADEVGYGIITDMDGNSYVTGMFCYFGNFGSNLITGSGDNDVFVAKIDTDGNWLWATPATADDDNIAICVDNTGKSYLTGSFVNTAVFGNYSLSSSGVRNIYVAKLGSGTAVDPEIISASCTLSNYPNPFNPSTTISFDLNTETSENIELVIYNLKGEKIKTLVCGNRVTTNARDSRSTQSVVWNGTDDTGKLVTSGIYFYKLSSPTINITRKMILLK
ncbi:MAG: SBBP repeat-containing protein [Candidatus Cloacimonadales bacterium]|nr:SBBP repeat-containing protein [Candidatus Cloacimonadales bacterium]